LKLSQEEKLIIEELRNLSKLNTDSVNDFLKSLMLITLLNFSEDESTMIPYFGKLDIKYLGDKNKAEGRVAELDVKFTPSDVLVKNIGQLVDVKNPNCDMKITDVECIKEIMADISKKLNKIMEKNS
jgi:hypothetical protein